MRKHTMILARTIVLATVAVFAGCNDVIDDKPSVVLEVATLTIPPVTGALDSVGGGCVFTITNASASFNDKPKNGLAITSPFNDIRLVDVTVTYLWDDAATEPTAVTGPAVFPVPGTVPANGSNTSSFSVVNGLDIISPSREGHTARLNLLFRGVTIAGDVVSVPSGGALTVNTCQ